MPVDTPSQSYRDMVLRWQKARDCAAGSHDIKSRGPIYLPMLAGHEAGSTKTVRTGGESIQWGSNQDDYRSYLERSLYYNATGRTIEGLGGMVFRRPPVVDMPTGADDYQDNVDLMGRSIESFARALLRELLTTSRAGVLVEHTPAGAEQPRPYMRLYTAEDILDVREEVHDGSVVPAHVRLREQIAEPGEDEFETVMVEQIRVLDLVDGFYRQRVFRRDKKEDYVEVEAFEPSIDGVRMSTIPFWTFGAEDGARPSQIDPPVLLDLCDVNLAHYRQEADYRNALHMAGVPTMVISGMDQPSTGPVKVGSAEVFFMPPAEAKAYFVSYGAEGAAAIRESLDDLQQMMAYLGARMLQPDKRGIEAAETAQIHRQGEISVLAALVGGLNLRLTAALRLMLEWALFTVTDDTKIVLNTDYLPTAAQPQMLTAMMQAWQAQAISFDSFWAFCQTGELVDPRRTAEEERELIEAEAPEPEPAPLPGGPSVWQSSSAVTIPAATTTITQPEE